MGKSQPWDVRMARRLAVLTAALWALLVVGMIIGAAQSHGLVKSEVNLGYQVGVSVLVAVTLSAWGFTIKVRRSMMSISAFLVVAVLLASIVRNAFSGTQTIKDGLPVWEAIIGGGVLFAVMGFLVLWQAFSGPEQTES